MKDSVILKKEIRGKSYLKTMHDTVFCGLVHGSVGFAYRIVEAIYTGCIPVLMTTQTHYNYMDLIDYHKIGVLV